MVTNVAATVKCAFYDFIQVIMPIDCAQTGAIINLLLKILSNRSLKRKSKAILFLKELSIHFQYVAICLFAAFRTHVIASNAVGPLF